MLIVYIGMYTALFPLSVAVGLWGAKEAPMPSKETLERFFRLEFAFQFFAWLVLYAVKFTFLILFRHIFGINKVFVRWWWVVFVYTWLTFWACFLEILWLCGSPSDLFVLRTDLNPSLWKSCANGRQEKCLTPYASGVINNFAEAGVAFNISSDLASKFSSFQKSPLPTDKS